MTAIAKGFRSLERIKACFNLNNNFILLRMNMICRYWNANEISGEIFSDEVGPIVNKKMKVIFCIKKLVGITGGAEWVLTSVANGLAERGHDVHIISFDNPSETSFYPISKRVCHHKIGEIGKT